RVSSSFGLRMRAWPWTALGVAIVCHWLDRDAAPCVSTRIRVNQLNGGKSPPEEAKHETTSVADESLCCPHTSSRCTGLGASQSRKVSATSRMGHGKARRTIGGDV